MKCILRYRAIVDLTFGDLFRPILCAQNPISSIMAPKLDPKILTWHGYQIKALSLRITLVLESCLYLILFQSYTHLYARFGKHAYDFAYLKIHKM